MPTVKWEPLREFVTLQDQMGRFLTDTLKSVEIQNGRVAQDWIPAVDIYEDAEEIRLYAELPGMEMKEIEVKVANQTLELKGEKKIEIAEKQGGTPHVKENYRRIERVFGRFARSFRLPDMVDQEKIKAKYDRGLLIITLPKREETKPKNITVQVE
ncbi:MAG: Hsp20/alpha crystallin family protein [Candidatus Manganitrophaceae bacterium]